MKKTTVVLCLFALALTSCEKTKVDISFNMEVADIYFNVDTTSTQGNLTLAATSFNSDLQQKLDENKASIDDVESIELTGAEFKMINAGSQNFDIVDKAYALISTANDPEKQIAYKDPVPNGATSFTLDVASGNLKDYLQESVINFKATGFTNGPNTERDSLQVILNFKIKAKVKP